MPRLARSLIWLRWRMLVNGLRGAQRRGALESVGRWIGALLPALLVVVLIPAGLGVAAGGFFLGLSAARGGTLHLGDGALTLVLRIVLLILLGMLFVAPIIRSAHSGGRDLTRFLLLPVRRRAMHLADLLAGLSDPWLAVLVPGFLFIGAGLAVGGAFGPALLALVSGLTMALFLIAVNGAVGFGVALLFRNRRRAEAATLLVVVLLASAGILPALLDERIERSVERTKSDAAAAADKVRPDATRPAPEPDTGDPGRDATGPEPGAGRRRAGRIDREFDAMMPRWTRVLPTELFVKSLAAGVEGRTLPAVGASAALAVWCWVAYAVSWRLYRRLLEQPATAGRSTLTQPGAWRRRRLPGLAPATAAAAWIQFRWVLRTLRGQTGVWLNCVFLGVLYLFLTWRVGPSIPAWIRPVGGWLAALAGLAFSQISLHPVLFNQFAIDRAGLSLQFLLPLSRREIVLGKLVGGGMLVGMSSLLCVLVAFAIDPSDALWLWLSLLPIALGGYALAGPAGLLLSVLFPKTADLSKMGHGGNPHPLAAVIGFLLAPASLLPGAGLAATGAFLLDSTALGFALSAGWMLIALGVGYLLTGIAEDVMLRRRENLLLVAGGR